MKLEGSGLSQRIVDIAELEPFMPEEGDMVKLLVPGEVEEPGQVNTYLRVDTSIYIDSFSAKVLHHARIKRRVSSSFILIPLQIQKN